MCYGRRFILQVADADLDRVTSEGFLKTLMTIRDALQEGRTIDRATILDMWMLCNAAPTMQEVASSSTAPPWSRIQTLDDWHNVDTVLLKMKIPIRLGQVYVSRSIPSAGLFRARMPRLVLPFAGYLARSGVPLVHPSAVFLPPHDGSDRPPRVTKVYSGGVPRYFKRVPGPHGTEGTNTMRELEILLYIQRESASNLFRVPIIHEAVRASEDGAQIYGFLLTYFPHSRTLDRVRLHERPLSVRLSWATQLRAMVLKLHTAGIVWGSARPGSVLVDETDNLWIVSFARTPAPRWVDRSKLGSFEGDLQGVAQMCSWLCGVSTQNTPQAQAHATADAGVQILATDNEIETWMKQLAACGDRLLGS